MLGSKPTETEVKQPKSDELRKSEKKRLKSFRPGRGTVNRGSS